MTVTVNKQALDIELSLLQMWASHGIEEVYKYKHRVKAYYEGRHNSELFYDLTSGALFQDIKDVADGDDKIDYHDITPEDCKVSVAELIRKRQALSQSEHNSLPHGPAISDYVAAAHANAVSKGWWDEDRSFGEIIALIHSEASEALEDFRAGKQPTEVWYEFKNPSGAYRLPYNLNGEGKPCGIPSELADIVIRVFDAAGRYGIDLEAAIDEKMAYNATRPQRHGGKVL